MTKSILDILKVPSNLSKSNEDVGSPFLFPPNIHIAHFFQGKSDLLEVIGPYFLDGLSKNEFCFWAVSFPLTLEEAKSSLASYIKDMDSFIKKGQLEIVDSAVLYGKDCFDAKAVHSAFMKKVEEGLSKGWAGFRCDGIIHCSPKDWKNYQLYEADVTDKMKEGVTALCSYDLSRLDAMDVMDVFQTHQANLVKRSGQWRLIDTTSTLIEERKNAEAALQHRSAVIESSSDAIITKTLEGYVTSWNQSAQRIFGYTAEEMIGQHITVLFPPDHIYEEGEIVRRIKQGERLDHFETIRRRKDGSLVPISLTVSPIKNRNGRIVGISKIARDISAQKEYEKKLIYQANELEQFAYVASHDLKEPLRKIAVYTQLLSDKFKKNPDDETRKYSDSILKGVLRLQNLINDLLSYSRVNKAELGAETVNLEETVRRVLGDLEISIKETKAEVTYDPLPSLRGSAFQIHQVLQNLISNAIKFHGNNPPQVHISSRQTPHELIVSVQDNGIGVDPKYQEKIFRLFQRLHTREKYPGTGIGLAICKKIIENHGGHIWVESDGEGSTFSFSLPISVVKALS